MDTNGPMEYAYQDPKKWQKIGFFAGEDYLVYVFKKTEKISAALYMLSGFLKDNEPVKWELREKGVLLLATALSLNGIESSDRNVHVQNFFTTALEVLTVLNISFIAGLVSKMNHTILTREIESVVSLMKDRLAEDTSRAGYVLSDLFFRTDDSATQQLPMMNTGMNTGVGNSNSGSIPSPAAKSAPRMMPGPIPYNIVPHNTANTAQNTAQNTQNQSTGNRGKDTSFPRDKKNNRQEIIVELLKKESPLTIKDFVIVITDCSEKTIQRELIDLVERGVIKKEGERRWSKYSMF